MSQTSLKLCGAGAAAAAVLIVDFVVSGPLE
jgi:hypothetical protein